MGASDTVTCDALSKLVRAKALSEYLGVSLATAEARLGGYQVDLFVIQDNKLSSFLLPEELVVQERPPREGVMRVGCKFHKIAPYKAKAAVPQIKASVSVDQSGKRNDWCMWTALVCLLMALLLVDPKAAQNPRKVSTFGKTAPLKHARCFQSRKELRRAVLEYSKDPSPTTTVAKRYGWPMNEWCVSQLSDFSRVFKYTSVNEDLSKWNVSNAVSMERMFYGNVVFNQDLSTWDTSKVVNFRETFSGCSAFQGKGIHAWRTDKAKTLQGLFDQASSFRGDVSQWNVGRVTNMHALFRGASSFRGNLGAWNLKSCQDTSRMFRGAASFAAGNLTIVFSAFRSVDVGIPCTMACKRIFFT